MPGSAVRWCDSHCHLQERYLAGAGFADAGSKGAGGAGLEAGALDEAGAAPSDGAGAAPLAARLHTWHAVGVERLVCVGTDAESSRQAISLARQAREGKLGNAVPQLWATVGLHPHDAATQDLSAVSDLVAGLGGRDGGEVDGRTAGTLAGGLVAVGECGLDYHYEHSPRDVQREVFARQIQLAHRHGLALVVHARDAWEDVFAVLCAEGVPDRTVLHCFTGGTPEARRALEEGMYLSFSGIVTFESAAEVREAAALCPLDRLLVETDSPFLAPVPHRGRPNEPGYVPLVGAAVAQAKGVEPAMVAEASWRAAAEVFGLERDGP